MIGFSQSAIAKKYAHAYLNISSFKHTHANLHMVSKTVYIHVQEHLLHI